MFIKPKYSITLELSAILQQILYTNDFVSLPGLGSFVRRYSSARIAEDGKSLLPPSEYFVFDTSRVFNDEAIENFLVEHQNISRSEAQKIIEEFCQQVKNKLEGNQQIEFHGLGFLKKSADGTPMLDVGVDSISSTFGLSPIEIDSRNIKDDGNSKVSQTFEEKKIEPTPTEIRGVVESSISSIESPSKQNKNFILPIVLVTLIAGFVALIIFIPQVRFWDKMQQIETISLTNQPQKPNIKDEPSKVALTQQNNKQISQSQQSNAPTSDKTIVEKTDKVQTSIHVSDFAPAPIDKKTALSYQEKVNEQPKTYYIIVGSFSNQQNAQLLIENLAAKGYKPIEVPGKNVYRVSIYQFSNHERAQRELERVRSLQLTEKAWLLTQ